MIAYWDASALVKLYVAEDGSDLAVAWGREASVWVTSRVAYVEVRAALGRARREGVLAEGPYGQAVSRFQGDWPGMVAVELADAVLQRVDLLVDRYGLRGLDLIHLSSTKVLAAWLPGEEIVVGCWDARLWECYRQEGFPVIPRETPGKV